MQDLTQNERAWCFLSEEEKQALRDAPEVLYLTLDGIFATRSCNFKSLSAGESTVYRLPPYTKDTIDWGDSLVMRPEGV